MSKVKPIKICHLADVHLGFRRYHRLTAKGFNQREVDVSAAFRDAVDAIVQLQPDLIVIAGDLFHSVRPSNAIVAFCFRQLKRLSLHTNAEIVILAGNHESPKRIDSGSILRLFREIDRISVADAGIETFCFPKIDASVTCVPHSVLVREALPASLRPPATCTHRILLAHAQVDERLRTEYGGAFVSFDSLQPYEWDYIALGHVHRFHQVTDTAAYPGSLEHTSGNFWAEAAQDKGFIVLQLPEKKLQLHTIPTRREVRTLPSIAAKHLNPEDLLALICQRLDAIPGGIDGKIVRLHVEEVSREVAKHLDYRKIRSYRARALHLQLDLRILSSATPQTRPDGKSVTLRQEIEEYCSEHRDELREPDLVQECLLSFLDNVEGLDEALVS